LPSDSYEANGGRPAAHTISTVSNDDPTTGYVRMQEGGLESGNPTTLEYAAADNSGTTHNNSASSGMVHFDSIALDKARADEQHVSERDDYEQLTYAESILSSVLTADCISDPAGFYVVCLVVLIGDMSRGVMFPTMWPLVESIGGDTVWLGYAVAAFSFGRILVSPMFGSWSIKYGYTRTLFCSTAVILLGTLLYAQVGNVGSPLFLIVAQIVLGVGSGTLGVTRAFVADVTPTRNRTTYMAWLTAVQYAGFTVTPFIGAAFYKLFSQEGSGIQAGIFVLNEFTAPAYFMSLICILLLIVISIFFQNRKRIRKDKKRKSSRQQSVDDFANKTTSVGITLYDACILGCMLLNVATKGSIASFETLGIAFAESHFDMYSSTAGSVVGSCGTVGVIALLSMGKLAKVLTDVQMIVGGMMVMVIGILSLMGLPDGGEISPSWRYWIAMFLIYSVGYPIGHTAVIGLFSKIVGRRPQGTLLGWFASAGSAARMVFPVMSGYVTHVASIDGVFIILCVVLGISMCFTFLARDTLENLIR